MQNMPTKKQFARIVKDTNAEEVGTQLFEYMVARAAHEGMEHSLGLPWYVAHVAGRAMPIFGIRYDTKGLVSDEQQPEFFAKWKALKRSMGYCGLRR